MEYIAIILLFIIFMLFIRGTSIREGMKKKKKSASNEPSGPSTSQSGTESKSGNAVSISGTEGSNKNKNEKSKKSNKKSNNKNLNKKVDELNNKYDLLTDKYNNLLNSQTNISQSQDAIKQTQQSIQKTQTNMDNYYRDLSNNILTQYTTFKNGLGSEYDTKMTEIRGNVDAVNSLAGKANASAYDAHKSEINAYKSFMNAKDIENNIFGSLSASVIHNDNAGNPGFRPSGLRPISAKDISGNNPSIKDISGNNPGIPSIKDISGNYPAIKDISGNNPAIKDVSGSVEPFSGFKGTLFPTKEGLIESTVTSIYTNKTNNKTIFDLENTTASSINDFYTSYTAYMKCTATGSSCSTQKADLDTKAGILETSKNALKAAYNTSGTTDISGAEYEKQKTAMLKQAEDIRALRSSIDQKFANIMKPMNEITRDYDASVYTGVALSVIAVGLAYYII